MKIFRRFLALLLSITFCAGCQSLPEDPPEVVDAVALERYTGLWYEIARLPVFFQDAEDAATARYTLNAEGNIDLINTAIQPDGSKQSVTGTAVPVPGSNGAKLRVTIDNFFAKLFGSPPEYGNYWILELADDYSMALVGSPDRESLWLLSRTPEVSEDRVDQYLDVAREKGYPVNDILMHEFE